MVKSVFTKIINKEVDSYTIFENNYYMAILDIMPLNIGHVIIFPKKQIKNFFDIDKKTYKEIMFFAKKLSFLLKKTLKCKKICLMVSGFEVFNHAHIHLIPANKEKELNISNKRKNITKENLLSLSKKLNKLCKKYIK